MAYNRGSVVRIRIATISTTLVLYKVGQISSNDLSPVEAKVRHVLNL